MWSQFSTFWKNLHISKRLFTCTCGSMHHCVHLLFVLKKKKDQCVSKPSVLCSWRQIYLFFMARITCCYTQRQLFLAALCKVQHWSACVHPCQEIVLEFTDNFLILPCWNKCCFIMRREQLQEVIGEILVKCSLRKNAFVFFTFLSQHYLFSKSVFCRPFLHWRVSGGRHSPLWAVVNMCDPPKMCCWGCDNGLCAPMQQPTKEKEGIFLSVEEVYSKRGIHNLVHQCVAANVLFSSPRKICS